MRNIVNAVLMKEGQVLLVYRSPSRHFYPDCWSLPGGHVEAGEAQTHALYRELREELDIEPLQFEFAEKLDTDPGPETDRATFHIYLVSDWSGEPSLQGDEHTELRWFPIAEAAGLANLALDEYGMYLRRLGASA